MRARGWTSYACGCKVFEASDGRDHVSYDIEQCARHKSADVMLDMAWGIIANVGAGHGNWATQSPEWQAAAARWRDDYHGQHDTQCEADFIGDAKGHTGCACRQRAEARTEGAPTLASPDDDGRD